VIIGAGPAGLTAAYELARRGIGSVVLEKDGVLGGLARTEEYKGYLFDIGGHRFFTKVAAVEKIWHDVLGSDFRSRPRLSRIYYRRKFFHYPLEPLDALLGLGLFESVRCCLSYLKARMFPVQPETTFTAWVSNRFGKRLFEIFFEGYTTKVWGIPCDQIQAEWAAHPQSEPGFGNRRRATRKTRRQTESHQDSHSRVSISTPRTRHDVVPV
jgi:protoporphyrinogen oxidase